MRTNIPQKDFRVKTLRQIFTVGIFPIFSFTEVRKYSQDLLSLQMELLWTADTFFTLQVSTG